MDDTSTKAAIIALVGAPNAGKSTLLNRILGRDLCIATPKPQTTQTRILGIEVVGDTQLVFTDTPGLHKPHGKLHDVMISRARSSLAGADIACWLVDASKGIRDVDRREIPKLSEPIVEHGETLHRDVLIVVNKVDVVAKPSLLPIMSELGELLPDAEIFPTSATRGEGTDALVERLIELAPEGPFLFPEDAVTDRPVEFMVAEYVREQLLNRMRQEIPYRSAVRTEKYEKRKGTDYFEVSIFVDTDSARKIIIGAGGRNLKAIGTSARKKIEALIGKKAFLKLDVKTKKNWQDDGDFLEGLGL